MEEHLMTIIYKLADGKRIRLEVTSEVMDALEESYKQIRSQRRQDRRYLKHTGWIAEFDDDTITAPIEDTADLLIRMDSYKRLYAALEKLSAIQRRRLEMRYLDKLKYRDIAEIEKVSYKTVEDSVARALKNLKKLLCTDR